MAKRRFSIPADFEAGTKECSHCHEIKPIEAFHKHNITKDGLSGACYECLKPQSQEYYASHSKEIIARTTQWNSEHPELRKQYNETWLDANREEQRMRRSAASKERYWSDPDRWRKYYRDLIWAANLWKHFHLTVDEYLAMLEAQGFACAMCHIEECKSGRRFAVDHDHACCPRQDSCGKCVRGLLCGKCNSGLGMFNDEVDLLVTAITYLEFHRERMAAQ